MLRSAALIGPGSPTTSTNGAAHLAPQFPQLSLEDLGASGSTHSPPSYNTHTLR